MLVPTDAAGHLFWLQSVAPDGPRFLAVSAASFFPEYEPVLPGAACDELGLADVAEAAMYCLVTVPDGNVADGDGEPPGAARGEPGDPPSPPDRPHRRRASHQGGTPPITTRPAVTS